MTRAVMSHLVAWKTRDARRPLLVRGARQVGKTYLVEAFGRQHFETTLTLDLERRNELHPLFESQDARRILQELGLYFEQSIVPGKTLLFLDEIQACPRAIATLRYFQEELPALHVIAAGSLFDCAQRPFDFALRQFGFPLPTGCVEYLHLEPLSFQEFLRAAGAEALAEYLEHFTLGDEIGPAVDRRLQDLLRAYAFVGGMPAAVAAYVERGELAEVQRMLASTVAALQDDFAKYGTRAQQRNMRRILQYVPGHIGEKLKYVKITRRIRSIEMRIALELLELSRIVTLVRHSSANGVPLGAGASETRFKPLLLDIGLASHICGLAFRHAGDLLTVHEGRLAEQFVGQELRALWPPFEQRRLHYWQREAKSANAAVAYLWAAGDVILPIAVRAGKPGSLKSVHVFLAEKKRHWAVRFDLGPPSIGFFEHEVMVADQLQQVRYTLLSLPLYLASQLERILADVLSM